MLSLYVGKVWAGVAPHKLFQTQREEPYLVRWAVFCEAVEWSGADITGTLVVLHGLNHVPILTMSVAVTVKRTTGSTHGKRHSIEGVGSGTTPLKRYQVVVRASCLSMLS